MIFRFVLIFSISICACISQAQTWTNYVSGASPYFDPPDIYCSAKDSVADVLYLGGYFSKVNGLLTHAIVKFDGASFDTLQCGIEGDNPGNYYCDIRNMTMYKNNLYVFGHFNKAGYAYCKNMAKWDGSSWHSLKASGFPDFAYILNDEMYVWGLDSIEGIAITGLAKFDGSSWYDVPIPHTAGHTASYIVSFQGQLFKSGQVTPASSDANLSYSDGTNWIPWVGISGDVNKSVFGMKVIDSLLWVYGRFNSIAGTQCAGLAAYNGTHWYGFGKGISTTGGWETVYNVEKINGSLYITGNFDKIEDVSSTDFSKPQTTNIAKLDGSKWCILNTPFNNVVMGAVEFKNEFFVYGGFEKIANDTVRGIGKLDNGFNNVYCSSDFIIDMSITGLQTLIEYENLKIFPNPTKNKLTVEFPESQTLKNTLEIISPTGEVLYSKENAGLVEEIQLESYSSGIYYLKIHSTSNQKVFKIIKE